VEEVVKIEMLEMLELAAGRGEQLLAHPHVILHRAADIQEQQHPDRVVPLRYELEVEHTAVARRGVDRAVEIELLGRPLARELAQLAQRELQVARTELDRVVEVAIFAPLPDLQRVPL